MHDTTTSITISNGDVAQLNGYTTGTTELHASFTEMSEIPKFLERVESLVIQTGFAKYADTESVRFEVTYRDQDNSTHDSVLIYVNTASDFYYFDIVEYASDFNGLDAFPDHTELLQWLSEVAENAWTVRDQVEYDLFQPVHHSLDTELSKHFSGLIAA